MLYLDTSALLKLFVREPGSDQVQTILESQDHPLPLWEIQRMELTNALWLKVFRKELAEPQAREQLALMRSREARGLYYFPDLARPALVEAFDTLSIYSAELGCRTLDVLHVACATTLEASLFVTFDNRQRQLAERAGLAISPNPRSET